MASWNRMCSKDISPGHWWKVIFSGDMLLSVNGRTSHQEMHEQMQTAELLKMTFAKNVGKPSAWDMAPLKFQGRWVLPICILPRDKHIYEI